MDCKLEVDTRENNFASIHETTFRQLFNCKDLVAIAKIIFNEVTYFVSVKPDQSVSDPHVIRLSRELARCWSLPVSVTTTVVVLPFPGTPKKSTKPIIVAPVSVDDWEVVETAAGFLEENILAQISVVAPGQAFPVWVGRGQKPVFLQVENTLDEQFQPIVLSNETEIAVEVLARKDVTISNLEKRGYMHARIVDEGFPSSMDLRGVSMICNGSDYAKFFKPDSGCLVTVRDRPDILAIIACDSSLVDPGVVIVSAVMRDKYRLVAGERIVIEEQTPEVGNNVIIPKSIRLHVPFGSENRKSWSNKFETFISDSSCVVLPQGGWIDLSDDPDQHQYCMVLFDLGPKSTSSMGAFLSPEIFASTTFFVDKLVESDSDSAIPRPFTKYLPTKVVEMGIVKSRSELNKLVPLPETILPSFERIVCDMHAYLETSLVDANIFLPFSGSGIVIGSTGSGRTTVLRQSVSKFSPPVDYAVINCSLLSSPSLFRLEDVKATISGLIRYGFETPPFGIVFDNVDELIPPEVDGDIDSVAEKAGGSMHAPEDFVRRVKRGKVIAAFMEDLIYRLKPNRSIFIAATATRDSQTLAKLFFHCEKLPSKLTHEDRQVILQGAPVVVSGDLAKYSLMELVEIRRTGRDNREMRRKLLAGEMNDSKILGSKTLTKLGGLDDQFDTLLDAITLPLHFPYLFPPGVSPATGAFIIGPSGCGKSALIDRIIAETKLPVEIVRGPDLLDKYIGASEQGVRRVFEKAASIAPCIVVFDAIEALCPRRGSEGTGVTDRVVNQMLCYLDGVERLEQVFVVAISSRPDMVDPALTRSGRLDITVICDIPDASGRREIVRACWEEFMQDTQIDEKDLLQLASVVADGCTGADIRAGFVNAKITCSRNDGELTYELILRNLKAIKPSISSKEKAMYDHILARYRNGPQPIIPANVGTKTVLH